MCTMVKSQSSTQAAIAENVSVGKVGEIWKFS